MKNEKLEMKILIFEKRHIIAKGLCSIIKEFENGIEIILIDSLIQFQNNIQNIAPDLLFVNHHLLEKLSDSFNKTKLQHTKIILITNNKSVSFNDFLIIEKILINEIKSQVETKIQNIITNNFAPEDEHNNEGEISERERDIVKLIAQGNTNQKIADQLFISPHTVTTHRKNITKKLGIKTVSGLTIYAILNNLIEI